MAGGGSELCVKARRPLEHVRRPRAPRPRAAPHTRPPPARRGCSRSPPPAQSARRGASGRRSRGRTPTCSCWPTARTPIGRKRQRRGPPRARSGRRARSSRRSSAVASRPCAARAATRCVGSSAARSTPSSAGEIVGVLASAELGQLLVHVADFFFSILTFVAKGMGHDQAPDLEFWCFPYMLCRNPNFSTG